MVASEVSVEDFQKAEMKQAIEDEDMDKVMTLMGTLLALGGGYDNEAGPPGGSSEGKCAD